MASLNTLMRRAHTRMDTPHGRTRVSGRERRAHEALHCAFRERAALLGPLGIKVMELANYAGFQIRVQLTGGRLVVHNVSGFINAAMGLEHGRAIDQVLFNIFKITQKEAEDGHTAADAGAGEAEAPAQASE
jgi:hypothetical protein